MTECTRILVGKSEKKKTPVKPRLTEDNIKTELS